MAIPTFSIGPESSGTVSPVAVDIPASPVAGDIIVAAIETGSGVTPALSGFTEFPDSPQDALQDVTLAVFWRRWQPGDGAADCTGYTNHVYARTMILRGCIESGDPFDVTSGTINGGAASATPLVPGDTTTVADCLVLIVSADGIDVAGARVTNLTWANSDLANISDRLDDGVVLGNGGGLVAATGEKAEAGTYGDTTFTYTSSRRFGAMTIAFKPPLVIVPTDDQMLPGFFYAHFSG